MAEKNPKRDKDDKDASSNELTPKRAFFFGGLFFIVCAVISFSIFWYLTPDKNPTPGPEEGLSIRQQGLLEIEDPDQVLRGAVYGLDPFIINLINNSGIIYLTVSVEFYDFVVPEDIMSRTPALRDYIISRVSEQSANTLTTKGPPHIEEILIEGLNEKISEDNPIEKVFVENFLIR